MVSKQLFLSLIKSVLPPYDFSARSLTACGPLEDECQLVPDRMLAYKLNCWLQLFQREENATVETMKHITLATARLRFLFLAARIRRHAGRVGVSFSDHYQEKGAFQQLMERLRRVARGPDGFAPALCAPLRA